MKITIETDKDYVEVQEALWNNTKELLKESQGTYHLTENSFYRAAKEAVLGYLVKALTSNDVTEAQKIWANEELQKLENLIDTVLEPSQYIYED